MQAGPKACVATTLINAGKVLDSFLRYHFAVGFSKIILFFDDPADPDLERAAAWPGVIAIPFDQDLQQRWQSTVASRRDGWTDMADREVMVRQIMNVEVALQIAGELGIDWLLHIDIDELFFTPGCSVPEHFSLADQAGVESITYLNLESVPEGPDIGDYFSEITLFKNNPNGFRRNAHISDQDWRTPAQKSVFDSVPGLSEKFFLFYQNGKSAVRVRKDIFAPGVHLFDAADRQLRHTVSTEPMILHFACCGFDHFWDKYRILGDIPDSWFGQFDIAKEIGRFHLDARDVVATGDRSKALEFFQRRVMIKDPDDVRRLLDVGLLKRVTGPQWLLRQLGARHREL